MTVATTEFIDTTGSNFNRAPLVKGTVRAIYVTGTGIVPETAAEITAAEAAGVGLIRIDQHPGLPLFRAGKADVADIEQGAATIADAVSAVAERQAAGIKQHVLYISYSSQAALKAAVANPAGVAYWVADYSWSLGSCQSRLTANTDWVACQYGDPDTNPTTLVPGTSVDLAMAQFDIDCGLTSWVNSFLPAAPKPAPAPALKAPAWPFGPNDYLGTPRAATACHSGYFSSVDNHAVKVWQQRMQDRGWYYQGARLAVDGDYGINEATLNQGGSPTVCAQFQAQVGLAVDHLVGPKTWAAAWTAPVTP